MKLRRLGILTVCVLGILAVAVGCALWGVLQPPEFYQAEMTRPADPVVRREQAEVFERRTARLVEEVRQSDRWRQEFDQDQINSWLAVELGRRFADALPAGVREPRVRLEAGCVDIGFQVQEPHKRVQTVVSLRLRPRLAGPNRLEVEIASIRAGLLPVPVEKMLDEAMSRLDGHGWKIDRLRRDGREVLQVDLTQALPAGARLKTLVVDQGRATVEGEGATGEAAPAEADELSEEPQPPADESSEK